MYHNHFDYPLQIPHVYLSCVLKTYIFTNSLLPSRHPTPDMSLGFKWKPTSFPKDSYLAITSSPSMKTFEDCEVFYHECCFCNFPVTVKDSKTNDAVLYRLHYGKNALVPLDSWKDWEWNLRFLRGDCRKSPWEIYHGGLYLYWIRI